MPVELDNIIYWQAILLKWFFRHQQNRTLERNLSVWVAGRVIEGLPTYFELVLILKRKFIFKSRSASPFPMKSNGLKFYKQLNLKCMKQILNINAKLRIQDIFLPSPVFLL